MGLSVATAEKLIRGKGVDRGTIEHAFARLGLPFNQDCWEPLSDAFETVEEPTETNKPEVSTANKRLGFRPWARWIVAALALGAVSASAWMYLPRASQPREVPAKSFRDHFARAFQLYHQGEYERAQAELAIAKRFNFAHAVNTEVGVQMLEGEIASAIGDLAAAETHFEEAIKLYERSDASDGLPYAYLNLGETLIKSDRLEEAARALAVSADLATQLKQPHSRAMAHLGLATVGIKRHEFSSAERAITEAETYFKRNAMEPELMDAASRRAALLREQGELDESRVLLQRCEAFWKQKQHARWSARISMELGLLERSAGNNHLARKHFEKARNGYLGVGDRFGQKRAISLAESLKS